MAAVAVLAILIIWGMDKKKKQEAGHEQKHSNGLFGDLLFLWQTGRGRASSDFRNGIEIRSNCHLKRLLTLYSYQDNNI